MIQTYIICRKCRYLHFLRPEKTWNNQHTQRNKLRHLNGTTFTLKPSGKLEGRAGPILAPPSTLWPARWIVWPGPAHRAWAAPKLVGGLEQWWKGSINIWLVVWSIVYFSRNFGNNNPNRLSYFSRRVETSKQTLHFTIRNDSSEWTCVNTKSALLEGISCVIRCSVCLMEYLSLRLLATLYSCGLVSQTQKFTPRRPCCLVHDVRFQRLHGDPLLCSIIVSIFARKVLKEPCLTCSKRDIRW